MSHNARVLTELQTGRSLTPMDALKEFGCFRLGARIKDLRNEGINIITTMVKQNGKRFASYRLA